MNTRPLPPSCPVCRGEGALDGDHGDEVCLTCGGSGEAPATLRAGVVAVLCLAAACAAPLVPVGWWGP
jgi:DnaJ-class molecular chaperone